MLLADLDTARMAKAYEAEAILCNPQTADAETAEAVWTKALQTWFDADAERFRILGVEQKYEYQPREGSTRSGVIDVWAEDRQEGGRLTVIDWKTTSNISDSWTRRQADSRQAHDYALYLSTQQQADLSQGFLTAYRGIDFHGRTKVIAKALTQDDVAARDLEIVQWDYLMQAAQESNGWLGPWPRNIPKGCDMFGPRYRCEFYDLCSGKGFAAFDIPEDGITKPAIRISPSSLEEFKRCPERFRLLTLSKLFGKVTDRAEATIVGKLVHAVLANAYEQLQERQK